MPGEVLMKANEDKTIQLNIQPEKDLSFTGIDYEKGVEEGDVELMVGNSSENIHIRKGFYIDK